MTQILEKTSQYQGETFLFGVCYFPEQWSEDLWEEDFKRMKALGMNVIRMGEGAWHLWEPEEGRYEFALFDRAIELATKHDLKVILGTPTYTPPAWLTSSYPEVLRVAFDGTVMHHGSRRHYNYTAPKYLELCHGVVTALAAHYGHDKRVIGWQIDNELNCHMNVSFAKSDDAAFQVWCEQQYGTLEALNTAWGTSFWAQHYSDWSQVHLPRPTSAYHNPGHLLDFYRFTSFATVEFSSLQYKILQQQTKNQFVTHNGIFPNVDLHDLTTQGMDFMSFDSYPGFGYLENFVGNLPAHFRDRSTGHRLSTVRGLSSKFLVLEQQSGPGGQSGGVAFAGSRDYLHATPRPGQMRLWAWHSVAHGADGILFFRWRTARFGAETLWHGLNHYGNQPSRRMREAEQFGQELGKISPRLLESRSSSSAAILYDYDNDSNVTIEGYLGNAFPQLDQTLYRTLSERHILADRINLKAATFERLKAYKIVFYPNAQMLESSDLPVLRAYVEQGGTLVFGPRSGYKDRQNQCHDLPFPGIVRELADIGIEDFTMLLPEHNTRVSFDSGVTVPALTFSEVLNANSNQVLATYLGGDDEGAAAIVKVPLGQGAVVYCGTFLPSEGIAALLENLDIHNSSDAFFTAPLEVEVIKKTSSVNSFYMLLNFSDQPQHILLHSAAHNLLTGQKISSSVTIAAFDVLILEE